MISSLTDEKPLQNHSSFRFLQLSMKLPAINSFKKQLETRLSILMQLRPARQQVSTKSTSIRGIT
ncbi:hypothetical protein CSA37_09255 [Candidatus Fermentibacteria bacterium]|nr:MAG: hypothetical protein CSA37_09255 [Candidatus Fermentibacteria bacterium]